MTDTILSCLCPLFTKQSPTKTSPLSTYLIPLLPKKKKRKPEPKESHIFSLFLFSKHTIAQILTVRIPMNVGTLICLPYNRTIISVLERSGRNPELPLSPSSSSALLLLSLHDRDDGICESFVFPTHPISLKLL